MLNRWDPFAEMSRIQDQFAGLGRAGEEARSFRPAVDIREESDAYVVHAELPGVKQSDIHVEVERGLLTVRGERKFASDEATKKTFRRVERFYGTFSRSFTLPENADAEHVSADLKDGVLDVRIPKKAQSGARKIEVKTNG